MARLISTERLAERIGEPGIVIADVRWEPKPPEDGIRAFARNHIPGAIPFDLDRDLADRSDLRLGRHPLPDPNRFVNTLAGKGIGQDTTLIVYDDAEGSIAGRLWWMMKWIGGPEAILLDGGLTRWQAEGRTVEEGSRIPLVRAVAPIMPHTKSSLVAAASEIETVVADGIVLLDARAPERYRGEVEPIDARAGHIPAAMNAPWAQNLEGAEGRTFRSARDLRLHYEGLGVADGSRVICSCGSGVTACHDLFALELAGFSDARLYVGSWSEWIVRHPHE